MTSSHDDPLRLLKLRLARGEIDEEQYDALAQKLGHSPELERNDGKQEAGFPPRASSSDLTMFLEQVRRSARAVSIVTLPIYLVPGAVFVAVLATPDELYRAAHGIRSNFHRGNVARRYHPLCREPIPAA